MQRIILCLLMPLTASTTAAADDTAHMDLQPLIDASKNDFQIVAENAQPLSYQTVLRWANNSRGSANGATMIWIHQGRPEAVCCIYPWSGRLEHAFGSLSRGRVRGMLRGQLVWNPVQPGVTFQDVPGAPVVAAQPLLRKRQMSELARQFSGTMTGWKKDNSDREELRLLNTPLYRYESTSSQIVDGALYAFAQGTDPEILLMLEAWSPDGQSAKWQYAFARRTSGGLEAYHKQQLVWQAEKHPNAHQAHNIHITFRGAEIAEQQNPNLPQNPDP